MVSNGSSASAGTGLQHFTLGGRTILRRGGRLTLEDGTLAGADCTLPGCVGHLVGIGVAPERALAMATSVPAACLGATSVGATSLGATSLGAANLGATGVGSLGTGLRADMVHLGADFTLQAVWRAGVPIALQREV